MTYRRVILVGFAAYFCALLWRVVPIEKSAETLAWVLPVAIVVILMLPTTRLQVGELLQGIKAWKAGEDGKGER